MTNTSTVLVLFVHRKPIIISSIIFTIVFAALIYFAVPIVYTSNASILPPESASTDKLSSFLQGSNLAFLPAESSMNSQLLAAVIKSRSSCEYVVEKLNLQKAYSEKSLDRTVKKLQDNVEVEVSKEGMILIAVKAKTDWFSRYSSERDTAKALCARIVSAFIEILDKINREKLTARAARARTFVEKQKTEVKIQLDSVEQAFAQFQKANRAISIPDQVRASIDAAARLKSEITAAEINLAILMQSLKEDNIAIIAQKTRLKELNAKYREMENRNSDILLSFKDAPDIGLKYTNFLRDIKSLNEVYAMLEQMYYKEKIQEQKDIATIEILDEPTIPERESSPRFLFTSAIGGLTYFLLMWFFFYYRHNKLSRYLRKNENV